MAELDAPLDILDILHVRLIDDILLRVKEFAGAVQEALPRDVISMSWETAITGQTIAVK